MPVTIKWGKDTPTTTVEWLWKPYIPYGKVTIIQGDGGEGKTTLMLKIAAMLSAGQLPPTNYMGRLFDAETVKPVTTFYASTEEEISDSALPRFIRNGGDVTHFAYSAEATEHMSLNYEDVKSAIEQTGAKLVIIDPLQAFLPRGVTLNNVSKMRPIFTQLSNVAMETSAAIVLVGHMNKNEAAKDIHRGLGSVDISASVRSIIVVGVDKDDRSLRTVRSVKSNFDESDFNPIGFRLDAKRCVYFCGLDDNDAYFESHSPRMFEAVGLLREVLAAGPVEHSEIKAILKENGISERTANRAKKELEIISKKADGKTYWIMPKASKID